MAWACGTELESHLGNLARLPGLERRLGQLGHERVELGFGGPLGGGALRYRIDGWRREGQYNGRMLHSPEQHSPARALGRTTVVVATSRRWSG